MAGGAAISSEGLAGTGGATSRMAPPMDVGRRPQFLRTWACPQGCVNILTTPRLAAPQRNSKEKATLFL